MVDKPAPGEAAERLQPSLLDRLTDDAPDERAEAPDAKVIDTRRLREIVRRDLAWLLNTTNLESDMDLSDYPCVAASTLNFGIREMTGRIADAARTVEMRQALRRAVERFEPRILPGTLEIGVAETAREGVVLSFAIRGELWAYPLPLELYLRTAMDVTTGETRVEAGG